MEKVRDFLNGPIGGLAPWIAMSLIAGPGRFELAVGVAFALSLAVVLVGRAGAPGRSSSSPTSPSSP